MQEDTDTLEKLDNPFLTTKQPLELYEREVTTLMSENLSNISIISSFYLVKNISCRISNFKNVVP